MAELLYKLEENGPGVKLLPKHVVSSTIYIHDAMAVLQMMSSDKNASFQQLANVCMDTLLHCLRHADTVVDVFDNYGNKVSVKSAERERRQSPGRQYQVIAKKSTPPWKKAIWLHLKIRQHSTSSSLSITQKEHVNHKPYNPAMRESW